ncbi:hypothetical protein NDU88_001153 [Pleurodeles waltl]|uniref:Uncharacterized protein n=1 Tax=Pleurodeles waltl TaxID=8319 RepID=A0AAV7M079_PLEWA|nr:hypothetical protein NDU88_001153 [Pleurodeles waltl]
MGYALLPGDVFLVLSESAQSEYFPVKRAPEVEYESDNSIGPVSGSVLRINNLRSVNFASEFPLNNVSCQMVEGKSKQNCRQLSSRSELTRQSENKLCKRKKVADLYHDTSGEKSLEQVVKPDRDAMGCKEWSETRLPSRLLSDAHLCRSRTQGAAWLGVRRPGSITVDNHPQPSSSQPRVLARGRWLSCSAAVSLGDITGFIAEWLRSAMPGKENIHYSRALCSFQQDTGVE